MKKGLKNILLTGATVLSLAGGLKGQDKIDVFSPVNANGIEWSDMNNKSQRDSLWNNFLVNDWVSEVPATLNPWDCTEYTRQLITNNYDWGENIILYDGYSGDPINDSLQIHNGTLRDMGKGGYPVQWALIPEGSGHDMNAILTGDSLDGDITIWENWNFTEPQFDQMNVQPGQAYMPSNCDVIISHVYVNQNDNMLDGVPIVTFHIENGVASTGEINPYTGIYTNRLQATDREFEEAEILSPKADTTFKDNDAVFEYRVKDKNIDLENSYYEFNGNRNYLTDTVGSIPLDSKQGLNKLELFAIDKAGNSKQKSVEYTYDTTTTSITDIKELSEREFPYPNPAIDFINLSFKADEEGVLTIYSLDGKEVKRANTILGIVTIDLRNYASGVYLYKYVNVKEIVTGKFIVK